MPQEELADSTAIITGASRGIGRDIALGLADQSVNVVIAARSEDDLMAVADDIQDSGGAALAVSTDISDQQDVKQLFKTARSKFGQIDILVNNASISEYKKMWEHSEEEWESILNVNLSGVYRCTREALTGGMLERGEGTIINMSSVSGKTGFDQTSAYTASKYGVQGLTNVLAKELKDTDIRVSAICPGQVNTEMSDDIQEVDPLVPEDITDIVIFLASRHSGMYIPEIVVVPPASIPITTH